VPNKNQVQKVTWHDEMIQWIKACAIVMCDETLAQKNPNG
jgi:hypothetical protein